ncbi:MAG: nitrate reductase cytochrome c-type subunit, partial [Gammaproteobacteria bacterium]
AFLPTLGLVIAVAACASNGGAIDELNMGLSKASVFDTPTPAPYAYSDAKPGWNDPLPRAWEDAPPQIPHQVDKFLPIVAADNQCLDCHDVPRYIDQPRNTDRSVKSKSPMSRDHYASNDLDVVSGARFTCTQCHVPQSNAAPLVESTYR